MNILKIIILVLMTPHVFAEAGAGPGHLADLVLPVLNSGVFFGAILFLSLKPVREMFNKNAKDVEQLYNTADQKDKEAQIKLDMYEKKISLIKPETEKLLSEAMTEAKLQVSLIEKEARQIMEKMEEDSIVKVKSEISALERQMNSDLVDEVIKKTKIAIGSNEQLQVKATAKLVGQIN